jgi:hypothetical protein
MRAQHYLFIAIALIVGIVMGFALGVMTSKAGKQLLDDLLAIESRAEVDRPQSLERPRFRVEYPGNWKIDSDDEDYDPDGLISIDSPGSSYVQLTFSQDEGDLDSILEIYLDQFRELMSEEKEEALFRYAGMEGKGVTLRGKVMGYQERIRIFALHSQGITVTVAELAPISDLKLVQPGLNLIEKSLRIKPPPGKPADGPGSRKEDASLLESGGQALPKTATKKTPKKEGTVPAARDG